MADAKISFRIEAEKKSSLIKTAKEAKLTLTQYILWIFDMHEEFNSMSMIQMIDGKSDAEISKIIKESENEFQTEFEKGISNAYLKGYQDGRKEIIKSKH